MTTPIPKGNPIEGNMATHLDSRFLNSTVLEGALAEKNLDALPVTIDRVEHLESLKYENGTVDKDVVLLYFSSSDKPLKLCKDNITRLIRQLGPMGKDWHGKKIKLVIEQCRRPDLGGQQGPCVRIARRTL